MMVKAKLFVLTMVVTLFAAACSENLTTGIEGTVLVGPICSELELEQGCEDYPYRAVVTVLDENVEVVQKVQTDDEGYFQISLEPGMYRVFPESLEKIEMISNSVESEGSDPLFFPIASDELVEVKEEEFSEINFIIDSGIR